jgi:putative inorganic carbon (hco3(-)) transporter
MRDIFVSLIIFSTLPACYRRPFVGLVVFSWLAYMRVQDLAWGFARDMRWSYYVATLTFSGYVVSKERARWFLKDPRCYMMMALAVLIFLGVFFSEPPHEVQWTRYIEYCKIVAIALFTTAIVSNRERLRVMVWVIGLSLGFYGVKCGIWGFLSGGGLIQQGPGGMLADNNDFALALAMSVPLLFVLGLTERNRTLRRAFWFALPMTVITVGLTQSRGGFLSVSAAIGILIWHSRSRLLGISAGLAIALVAVILMPQDYKDRLNTLRDYKSEGSAASRVRAWGIATRMAKTHPVLGVGMTKFPQHFLRHCNDPTPLEKKGKAIIVAHSSYFQIWAECGTIALGLYFTMIFSCFWTLWRIRREAISRYFSSWIIHYAVMFEASLLAFCVGSAFLNRGHFDLLYQMVALVVVFAHLARREMRDETLYPMRSGGRGEIRHVRRHGFAPRASRDGFTKRPLPQKV